MKITFIFIYFVCVYLRVGKAEKNSFPETFLFGFSTSSYQIEGGWKDDKKGENIWDRFVHTENKVKDGSNGDIACDSYHRYKEDVAMLKNLGANVYRFSLSWSRILPRGDLSYINQAGINYYKNLINELVANNIQPMVTLYHWDLPQLLQNLGGWTNPVIIDYFQDYANLAFSTFGKKVKWWITFNEPLEVCESGYGVGTGAPGYGMSGTADYLCGHTLLKAHARAYNIYDKKYRFSQQGKVGISLNGGWNEPLTNSASDIKAAEIAMEFQVGWFLHPILRFEGDYPKVMRIRVDQNSKKEHLRRSRLPHFTKSQRKNLKGTIDFLGVNHYTTYLTTHSKHRDDTYSFKNDMNVETSQNVSWPGSALPWLKVEPTGFRKKLNWFKEYTNNFPVFVTENGYADYGELDDQKRINYHTEYLNELLNAIREDGCNVIGYIAWSLMDNFEWLEGYRPKFGVYHVDFSKPDRQRTPKFSVNFFQNLIKTKTLDYDKPIM